jgi:hypothetical protein
MEAQVHHSDPLEWAHLKPNADPNRLANLWALRREAHDIATNAWSAFSRSLQGRVPTQAEIMEAKLRIDRMVALSPQARHVLVHEDTAEEGAVMRIPVAEAAREIEARGMLRRLRHDQSDRIIDYVGATLGRTIPPDLADFYRERIEGIGDFTAQSPAWNAYVGWQDSRSLVTELQPAGAISLFDDGCGSLYGLDLMSGEDIPAVYFFDHEDRFEFPSFAAGSSLGAFLLLLADHDRSYREGWPEKWELKIDPDIDKCKRARAIWAAGQPVPVPQNVQP